MGEFSEKVYGVVKQIPHGKVSTYGQIGALIGCPRSARYVGYALRANPSPGTSKENIPCHRVVFKDGALCKSFAFGGPDEQRQMLEAEGVTFSDPEHIDMDNCQWDGRSTATESDEAFPTQPPTDFDWKRELGDI